MGRRGLEATVPFYTERPQVHHALGVTSRALDRGHICRQNVSVFVKKKVHLITNYLRDFRMPKTIYIDV